MVDGASIEDMLRKLALEPEPPKDEPTGDSEKRIVVLRKPVFVSIGYKKIQSHFNPPLKDDAGNPILCDYGIAIYAGSEKKQKTAYCIFFSPAYVPRDIRSTIHSLVASPDGKRIAFCQQNLLTVLKDKHYFNFLKQSLKIIGLTRKHKDYLTLDMTLPVFSDGQWQLNEDGTMIRTTNCSELGSGYQCTKDRQPFEKDPLFIDSLLGYNFNNYSSPEWLGPDTIKFTIQKYLLDPSDTGDRHNPKHGTNSLLTCSCTATILKDGKIQYDLQSAQWRKG